jgi:hypothetical protein
VKPPRDTFIVRASYLSGWPDCPRRGASRMFRFVVEMMGFALRSPPSSIGAAVGSGVHAGARAILDEKARTGELPPLSIATDAAVATIRERVSTDGAVYDNETRSLNEAEQQAVKMARVYRGHIAPTIQPLLVEQRFEATVPWAKNPIVLSGQADLVAQEPNAVDDLKTGKARGNHRPQLGSYSLVVRSHEKHDIRQLRETFIQRTRKDPVPQVFVHDLEGSEQAAVAILRHVDDCLATFLEGDERRDVQPGDPWAFPANPSSKLCSDKFCSAWGTEFCREHDKGVRFNEDYAAL